MKGGERGQRRERKKGSGDKRRGKVVRKGTKELCGKKREAKEKVYQRRERERKEERKVKRMYE